jgi:superfamily II RNA helicase
MVESILENPEQILRRQVDYLKTEKLAELKAAGVEYDQRMEELEKIDYPKPNAEFIYEAFNAFARLHPWVGEENIRPKCVAREMFENLQSFPDYVKDYGLERSEGLLLRYLSDVYKTLTQTVPAADLTEQVEDIVVFLRAIVRSTDSSLVDEWESMQRERGEPVATAAPEEVRTAADRVDVTTDEKAFTVLVRNALFSILRSIARGDYESACAAFETGDPRPKPMQLQATVAPFFEEHRILRLDPPARSPQFTRIVEKNEACWRVEQILCDPDDANDWVMAVRIDLELSRGAGHPVLALDRFTGA